MEYMINAGMGHVKTIEEFQKDIRRQQEEAHGKDYCAIHDAILKYMKNCNSYMELGTHVGGTAAVALLAKPKDIYLIDVDTSRYRRFLRPLAESYAKEHNINLDVKECDSRSLACTNVVDMLVIDSYHHPKHLTEELDVHGQFVRKYIIAHDTSVLHGKPNESLYKTLVEWGKNKGWGVIERGTTNVGYTVIGKK